MTAFLIKFAAVGDFLSLFVKAKTRFGNISGFWEIKFKIDWVNEP